MGPFRVGARNLCVFFVCSVCPFINRTIDVSLQPGLTAAKFLFVLVI